MTLIISQFPSDHPCRQLYLGARPSQLQPALSDAKESWVPLVCPGQDEDTADAVCGHQEEAAHLPVGYYRLCGDQGTPNQHRITNKRNRNWPFPTKPRHLCGVGIPFALDFARNTTWYMYKQEQWQSCSPLAGNGLDSLGVLTNWAERHHPLRPSFLTSRFCLEETVEIAAFALSSSDISIFIGFDGKPTRKYGLAWSEPPIVLGYSYPYVIAVLSKLVEVRTISGRN